jgi:hypothetical protein
LSISTGQTQGEIRYVAGYGLYQYDSGSAAAFDSPNVIAATVSGRWITANYGHRNANNGMATLTSAGYLVNPLQFDAVYNQSIVNNAVTTAKIADAQVTASKLSPGAAATNITNNSISPSTVILGNPSGNSSIEIGKYSTAETPFIDFHSSGTGNDYDVRLIASGGNATPGNGILDFYGLVCNFNSAIYSAGNITVANMATRFGTSGGGNAHISLQTTSNVPRFQIGLGGTEGGSSTGSNFYLWRYNDAGNFLGEVFSVNRQTGSVSFGSGDANVSNGKLVIVKSTNANASYAEAQLRIDGGASGFNLPRIGFHAPGVVASQIGFFPNDLSGTISVLDNPGTSYQSFAAADIFAKGVFVGRGSPNIAAEYPTIYVTDSSNYTIGMGALANEGVVQYRSGTQNTSAFGHRFVVNNIERLKIDGTGNVTAFKLTTTSNGLGDNIVIGDDAVIGDINLANGIGLKGQANANVGYIKFGSGLPFGFDGTNLVYSTSTIFHSGNFNPSIKADLASPNFSGTPTIAGNAITTQSYVTSAISTAIAPKADTSTVNSQLSAKADTTTVNSQLANKTDKSAFITATVSWVGVALDSASNTGGVAYATQTFTIAGVNVNDFVMLHDTGTSGVIWGARVTAANTIDIHAGNLSRFQQNTGNRTLYVRVMKYTF